MQNVVTDNSQVVVDVDLKPHDVYTPFLWSQKNVARWAAAIFLCPIFYILYERLSATILSFPTGRSTLVAIVALMVSVLVGLLLFPYVRMRCLFRKSPALTKTRRYTVSARGITIQSDDASGEYKWSLFQRVVETRNVFAFFTSSWSGIYVPKRCFTSQEDIPRMRDVVRQQMPAKYRLRSI